MECWSIGVLRILVALTLMIPKHLDSLQEKRDR
jgi:hypothetical protein